MCDQSPQNNCRQKLPPSTPVSTKQRTLPLHRQPQPQRERPRPFRSNTTLHPRRMQCFRRGPTWKRPAVCPTRLVPRWLPLLTGVLTSTSGPPVCVNVGLCFSCSGKPCVNPVNATESPRASAKQSCCSFFAHGVQSSSKARAGYHASNVCRKAVQLRFCCFVSV